jgi:hypothetical protein
MNRAALLAAGIFALQATICLGHNMKSHNDRIPFCVDRV